MSKAKIKREPKGPFIVWSPNGETPPKVSHDTHGKAHFAACEMAKKHPGQQLFVMCKRGNGAFVEPSPVEEAGPS